MNTQLLYLPEPKLTFGYSQQMEDPRDGLTLFGPYEQLAPHRIRVGVVGTSEGIEKYQAFVTRLQLPIFSPSNKMIQRPHFPGFESVFGVQWSPAPDATIRIDPEYIESALANRDLKKRTHAVVNIYLDRLKRFQAEEETSIDIWFIIVPTSVSHLCRANSDDTIESTTTSKELKAFKAGQLVLFPEMAQELEAELDIYDSSADFHHQLKARLLQERIQPPVQVVLESTLMFRDRYRMLEHEEEMKAHIAWTQSATVYYKLGKLPWKLQGIRRGVCYIGLTFKKIDYRTRRGYACSAAQMFLDSGDGTVFRGNVGPWRSQNEKEFHLDHDSAAQLLSKALQSYFDKKREYPTEVFIHGRAGFENEEWTGFTDSVKAISPTTKVTGIVIRSSGKLKLFRDVPNESSQYGNLRGLAWVIDNREGYLFSTGYVPRLRTSLNQEMARPLRIQIGRGDASIEQVMKDILALTKLNYNACIFGDGLPVTLRFSDAIGNILTAVDSQYIEAVLPFKYYI